MVSSSSTQISKSPSIPIIQVQPMKPCRDKNVTINFGPFAPPLGHYHGTGASSSATVPLVPGSCYNEPGVVNGPIVPDLGNTSSQPPKKRSPKKLFPTVNSQGLIVVDSAVPDSPPSPKYIPSPAPTIVAFVVKSLESDDPGVQYNMVRSAPFFTIYNDYAERLGYSGTDIRLRHNFKRVSPIATPDDIDLQDGDAIIATPKRPGWNMDTRYKVFDLRPCDNHPHTYTFKAKVGTSIQRVIAMLSDYTGMDRDRVVLVRCRKIVPQIGTVGQSDIRNQDLVYAFPRN